MTLQFQFISGLIYMLSSSIVFYVFWSEKDFGTVTFRLPCGFHSNMKCNSLRSVLPRQSALSSSNLCANWRLLFSSPKISGNYQHNPHNFIFYRTFIYQNNYINEVLIWFKKLINLQTGCTTKLLLKQYPNYKMSVFQMEYPVYVCKTT